jgi:hypothetical protein
MPVETPSGTVDGSNATFTLSTTPGGDVLVYNNGVLQESGYDYSRSSATLTFLSGHIPQTGDRLVAAYGESSVLAAGGASGATTVAQIVRDAFLVLGVLASEETPSASEESDALRVLNRMLDSWAAERLVLSATLRSTHTLTVALNPHTIGTGGTFATTRPVRIDRASIIPLAAPGSELPLDMLDDNEFQGLQGKTTAGRPFALWVETSYPTAKLHLFPIPNAADTLVLYTWQQIGRFTATSDSFDMPPGYERAIVANLAKALAPQYGVTLSAEAAADAGESKAALKRLNYKPIYAQCDSAVLGGGGFNIISGDN